MSFDSFGFDARIEAGIKAAGFTTPTPIQHQAIPPALEGRDVMGLAQTGTGKTAAFVLPIMQSLLNDKEAAGHRRIRALILSPTRELAEQTHEAIEALGEHTGLRSMTIYGGASMNRQLELLAKGVDIVVACPGRLLDHMGQDTLNLKAVSILVLDEADRMMDMGFIPDIRRILKQTPSERQTLMFSATMPEDILRLSESILRKPVHVQVDNMMPARTVSHALYPVPQHLKTSLLIGLLESIESDSVLVFTRTKVRAKRIKEKLASKGFKAATLEGNMTQSKRQQSINGFRSGKYQILVATDIASRGMDISSISHVINYDIPDTADAYTHRVGRTGRAMRTGEAFTLVTTEDAEIVQAFEKVMDVELICKELEGFDYDAPAPSTSSHSPRRHSPPSHAGRGRRPSRRAAS